MTRSGLSRVLLLAPLAAGCAQGHGKLPIPGRKSGLVGDGGSTQGNGSLSDFDLEIVRSELGSLPAVPPPDLSNDYANDDGAAVLGQKFFFEARYSSNAQVSCASCHDPSKGFQDERASSQGANGFTGRHSPTLLNAAYGSGLAGSTVWQFWDGRADSEWSQALAPPENPTEMQSTRIKVTLLIYDKYKAEYEAIFPPLPALRTSAGDPVVDPTIQAGSAQWKDDSIVSPTLRQQITLAYVNFGKAIAAYERKLVSTESRFDQFYRDIAAGTNDSSALGDDEKLGLKLFVGKGKCTSCHRGPNFTDWKFHNIGVPQVGDHVLEPDNGRSDGITKVVNSEFNCASAWSDQPNKSACAVSSLGAPDPKGADMGAFKTPTLRSVSSIGPYFHTGAVTTLADVVAFYDNGGADAGYAGTKSGDIQPIGLSDAEKKTLVAFLGTLVGAPLDAKLTTPPQLPP